MYYYPYNVFTNNTIVFKYMPNYSSFTFFLIHIVFLIIFMMETLMQSRLDVDVFMCVPHAVTNNPLRTT